MIDNIDHTAHIENPNSNIVQAIAILIDLHSIIHTCADAPEDIDIDTTGGEHIVIAAACVVAERD